MNAENQSKRRVVFFRPAVRSRLETVSFIGLWGAAVGGVVVAVALALTGPDLARRAAPALADTAGVTNLVSFPRPAPPGQLQADLRTLYHMMRYLVGVEWSLPAQPAPAALIQQA